MSRFPFEAVLFDLDGTLVATERFWPDAARAATLRFFTERGIERPVPTTAEWMSMVGLPLHEGFDRTLGDLAPDVRAALMDACVEEEHAMLARGRAALLGGVREALTELASHGVRLGIASNCGPDYLELMMRGLGLGTWIEEGRCLASPGVSDKADMIEDLLHTFGTRSAVMVGDRRGDRDAAWANGVPHVHIPRGYGGGVDDVVAEAVLDGMDQLLPTLRTRDEVLGEALAPLAGARVVAVTGLPLAGKTLAARDLARLAERAGVRAEVIPAGTREDERDPEAIEARVAAALAGAPDDAELVLLDGPSLLHERVAPRFDASLRVTADEAALVRLAQDWVMRAPLVRGQGNFGSQDGDAPAAYRYTEARLEAISLELLTELKQKTVPYRPTFDATRSEPAVLPARFPNLLVNGAQGIAVGMATSIPPHNLGEVVDACVALIDDPKLSVARLLGKVKGPDFPTGGELVTSRADLRSIYESGQGSVKLRGQWKVEKANHIILTSLPYALEKRALV
ncbi:MAG: DNA gyrase subunit A, partial [Planctomycetota bacterium]